MCSRLLGGESATYSLVNMCNEARVLAHHDLMQDKHVLIDSNPWTSSPA